MVFGAGESLGQRREHLKAQNRFLASEDHWETHECSTEEGVGLKEQTTASTVELLPFSVPRLTGLTATGIWKSVSSSLLSSSDPPQQAVQCFSKTTFLQLDKSWDPDQRNPSKPKTPQIKQKEGSCCEILKYSQVYEPYRSIVGQERGQTHKDLNERRKTKSNLNQINPNLV